MEAREFQQRIIILDDRFNKNDFPERFSNEVYLSKTTFIETKYVSPFTIKYVDKGFDLYRVNNKPVGVGAGNVLIANDGSDIELLGNNKKSHTDYNTGMSVFLDKAIIQEIFNARQKNANSILETNAPFEGLTPLFYDDVINHDPEFVAFIKNLYLGFQKKPDTDLDAGFYYSFSERIIDFQFKTLKTLEQITQKSHKTKKEIIKRVAIGREVINSLGNNPFDLTSVANEACLSKYLFIRCFKQVYQTTPQRYYLVQKMADAINLLKKSYSVSDVASMMDYPSIQSFSRQFKQVTGKTPRMFKVVHG